MLESIHLKNVGPAPEMKMDLAPRLNLLTGDNGLGKSFLLDVAWWALTRTWAREMAIPKPRAKAEIAYAYTKKTNPSYTFASKYEPGKAAWPVKPARPPIPGLILYAQVDGGFSVWDPARNYWREDKPDRPNAFLFAPNDVWRGNRYCKGLLDDWNLWQAGNSATFEMLKRVLETLSPAKGHSLIPGDPRRLTVDDPQRYPTLRMPYGEDVAVVHASAGMRRILGLAYLLTWAWQGHLENVGLHGKTPTREIVFLIDEVEAHLHPEWQRRIVPALLAVMDALTGQHNSKVQLIAATHAPLVLASVEKSFHPDKDKWFDLDLDLQKKPALVTLEERQYERLGDVDAWLTSAAFDMGSPRSVDAELALDEAANC